MSPTASKRAPYADAVDKEPAWQHVAMADWLTENTGYESDPKTIQLALGLANEWRQSDHYATARDAYVAERDGAKNAKRERVLQAKKDRAAKLIAQANALLADVPAEAPEPPVGTKAPAKVAKPKAAKATAPKPPVKAAKPAKPAKLAAVPPPSADDDF